MAKKTIEVLPQDFVKAWETSECIADAAAKLGMTQEAVSQRARSYRKQGVQLKKMPSKVPLSVEELNHYIKVLHADRAYDGEKS